MNIPQTNAFAFALTFLFSILVSNSVVASDHEGEDRSLAGYFKYKNEAAKTVGGMQVKLLDEAGTVVGETQTDQNGYFVFEKLEASGNYLVNVEEAQDVELTLVNNKQEQIGIYLADEQNIFSYRKLESNRTGTQHLVDESNIDFELNTAFLDGQFLFLNQTMDQGQGVEMHLVDEAGAVVMTTTTAKQGYFMFNNLPMDKNYFLQVEEPDGAGMVKIYNREGAICAQLATDNQGTFSYQKLLKQERFNLDRIDEKDMDVALNCHFEHVLGQFSFDDINATEKKIEVVALNESGQTISTAALDRKGYFHFTELPQSHEYVFQLKAADNSAIDLAATLSILDKKGNILKRLKSKDGKYFKFLKLAKDTAELKSEEVEDASAIIGLTLNVDKATPTIYFSSNSSNISTESAKVLREVLKRLQQNKDLRVEISSHTDSRGSEDHNEELSHKRYVGVASYLVSKGISISRISGKFYGEEMLLNDCADQVQCPDDLHRQNRRAEFRLY